MANSDSIRISASELCKISDPNDNDRLLLLLNKSSLARGDRVLSPIGGAIEVTQLGRATLKDILTITDDNFEKGMDLRLTDVPVDEVNAFMSWFVDRVDRETNPRRELTEELVHESRVLEHASQLDGTGFRFLGYATGSGISKRSETYTVQVGEVHDVTLPTNTLDLLLEVADHPESPLAFVDADEIRQGRTRNEITIASISSFLLDQSGYPDNPLTEQL